MRAFLPIALALTVGVGAAEPRFAYRSVSQAQGIEHSVDMAVFHRIGSNPPGAAVFAEGEWVFDNGAEPLAQNGATRRFELKQQTARPFCFSVETRCEKGPGGRNDGYSLFLDLTHADGSKTYGELHAFTADPSLGWQKGEVLVDPGKPVRDVSCYLLWRRVTGKARFRNLRLREFPTGDIALFDTTPVQVAEDPAKPVFLLHDAADENSGWRICATNDNVAGLKLDVRRAMWNEAEFFSVDLQSRDERDHAITLAYSLPLPEGRLVWLDDPRTEMPMDEGQFRNTVNPGCGNKALNHWPIGAVRAGGETYALGYDPAAPAVFRVVGNGGLRRLFIAFDLGFTPEKRDAHFGFVAFWTPASEGFRGAYAKYAELFPDAFETRIKKHGIWMVTRRIGSVAGWEDFGFGVKEGTGDVAWEDAHGILSFPYVESSTWWMKMPGTNAFTFAEALSKVREEGRSPKGHPYARAWAASTYHDEKGQPTGVVCDAPWCRGVCWNMNPLPRIPGGDYAVKLGRPAVDAQFDQPFPLGYDGQYLDSAENHLPPRLDFRRENFKYAETPLCWAPESKRPSVATALAIYECFRDVAKRMRGRGKFVHANSVSMSWPWLAPWTDYGGQEVKWIEKGVGRWRPMADRDLLYRRAISFGRPYCLLMNVKFENLTDEMVEKYFQRCLAYGMLSSFFSPNAFTEHYFDRPDLYNRHRHLFRKYVPMQRAVSEAGWRPVNRLAVSETAGVFAEQFGNRFVTIFNPSDKAISARIRCLGKEAQVWERMTARAWTLSEGVLEMDIPPETVRLLDFVHN